MKKLYVNVPVKYRKREDVLRSIDKMHKIAEIEFDQKLELIMPPLDIPGGKAGEIKYISECVSKLADADFCVSMNTRGRMWDELWCINSIIRSYNIETVWTSSERIMPDMAEIENLREF